MTTAVCPGSFDPITNGHLDVIRRAAGLFSAVTVLVTGNPAKRSGMFSIAERVEMIRRETQDIVGVSVDCWSGLLVDYTSEHGIGVLVKGLRSATDYEYEVPMAHINRRLTGIDTCFLLTDPRYSFVSSSLCKEVASYGGDVAGLVPPRVAEAMRAALA